MEPLLSLMGNWGVRWMQKLRPDEFDPVMLMLHIKREVVRARMPERAATVEICFSGGDPALRRWWLVLSRDDGVDVCDVDPGRPVDVWVGTDVATLTRVWMGDMTWVAAIRGDLLRLSGDATACRALPRWLETSPFAAVERAPVPLPR